MRLCFGIFQQELGTRIRELELGVADRRNQRQEREAVLSQKRARRDQCVGRFLIHTLHDSTQLGWVCEGKGLALWCEWWSEFCSEVFLDSLFATFVVVHTALLMLLSMLFPNRLQEIDNVKTRLLQALKDTGAQGVFDAYRWVESHRNDFQKEVYGPVLLEVPINSLTSRS